MKQKNNSLPIKTLIAILADHLHVPANQIRLEPCPTGKFNTTYFVAGIDRPLVLRIAPPDDPSQVLFYEYRMMRQEPGLHAEIQAHTDVPIPTIIAHDSSHKKIDRDYLIMEKMPGIPISDHPGLSRRHINNILHQVGRALKQVHAIQGRQYGYVGEHKPMESQKDWTSAFVIMWNKLLDDIEGCGGYSADQATYMRHLLDKHIKLFDRKVPASLLHMDVWAQNILADNEGNMTCLLDWDRALWGDPEIEFAVLDYCGISEPPFWEGYGSNRDTSSEAEVRQLFYLLYELQKYIFIRQVRYQSPSRAAQYRRQSLELARQLG
ncbi:MAG: aminoglycoside phosphotransferase family protein [Planctomycetota bacterium]|nr:MAG: aminoglycoside phosphotransferase family protein [Planctomycetota bacterium]